MFIFSFYFYFVLVKLIVNQNLFILYFSILHYISNYVKEKLLSLGEEDLPIAKIFKFTLCQKMINRKSMNFAEFDIHYERNFTLHPQNWWTQYEIASNN